MFLLFLTTIIFSQDYSINFAGTVGSRYVDSVQVENITQNASISFKGTDILNLKSTNMTAINTVFGNTNRLLKNYPNPTKILLLLNL
jgi:hypothetical protein